MMRIGVIASMKKGLEHFVYREVSIFSQQGAAISLFPTKFAHGLYNAQAGWDLHRWRPLQILLMQPLYALRGGRRYLRLLREAIETRSLVDFALAWHFAAAMRDVDVIYATFGDHKLFVGYFCKQIVDKPLVVTIHAYELYQNPNPRLFRRALDACDRIVTVTEYNREILTATVGVAADRVQVIRCSVDTDEYRPEERFVVLIVGFFAERKGHEILFRALKRLADPSIEVWVVGDEGTERSVDVPRLAREIGVADQVAFFGKLGGNALQAVYRACDVFCLPCRTDGEGVAEGFPAAIMEAMAFGKPVITTRHVEIPRIVPEILVDENDVDGLADAIRRARDSAELRARLSRDNRRIAEETFSAANATRTLSLFRDLTGLAAGPEGNHTRARPTDEQRATARTASGAAGEGGS